MAEGVINPLEALPASDVRPYIRYRPGGKSKQTGEIYSDIPYLPWGDARDLLDRATGRHWESSSGIVGDAVWVSVTVFPPDGGAITRMGLAEISTQTGNAPKTETAERSAFVRALMMFGLVIPKDVEDAPHGQREYQAPPRQPQQRQQRQQGQQGRQQAPPPDDGADRYCSCGQPIKGRYDQCYGCKVAPGRVPGVCAACGKSGIGEQWATCQDCGKDAAILPQYASAAPENRPAGAADALPPPPPEVAAMIAAARSHEDFDALMQRTADRRWVQQPWWLVALQQIDRAAEGHGLIHDHANRRFTLK